MQIVKVAPSRDRLERPCRKDLLTTLLCHRMDEIILMNIVHLRESGLRIAVSLTVVLVLISVRSPAQSKPQSEASAPYNFDSVRIYVRNAMKRKKDRIFPSLAIAVAKDGKIIWEEGFGWADVKKKIRATPDTMYSLASISKPVTATGVLKLVQEGKVDLDRPINDYLGNQGVTAFAGNARDATVRRVLSHKAGLPEYVHFFYEDEDYTPLSADETIARYGILVNPPGDVFCYSNLGFGILGDLIARVSNTTYASYMQSEVFTPLGMTHTSMGITRRLEGYAATRYDGDRHPIPYYYTDHQGASGVYSSAHDLVRFGMFHLKDHLTDQKQILSDASIGEMQKIVPTRLPNDEPYGLGWNVQTDHGLLRIHHRGGMPGVSTGLYLFPSENLAIVILTNSRSEVEKDLAPRIAAAIVPEYAAELQKDPPKANLNPPAYTSVPELLGQWSGMVRTSEGNVPISLAFQSGGAIDVKLSDQPKRLLEEASFKNSNLLGHFAGTVPTKDAVRQREVHLNLYFREGKLGGQLVADAGLKRDYYDLPFYVELTKVSDLKAPASMEGGEVTREVR
jgi:CubicO group peptidase (beta-lactamase class C family)